MDLLTRVRTWLPTLVIGIGIGLGLGGVLFASDEPAAETARMRLKAFAFAETANQARRTCASVQRAALAFAFHARSDDQPFGPDPYRYDDNGIALLYAEGLDIKPIRLQTAAYNGCIAGLRQQLGAAVKPGDVSFRDGGAKTSCRGRLLGSAAPPMCTLAFEDVETRDCRDRGPGGYDVLASGLSCREARQLRLPLGSTGFSSYRNPNESIYRPWLATGSVTRPRPRSATGWTCWARWDPAVSEDGIRHVCWRGTAVVLFKTA